MTDLQLQALGLSDSHLTTFNGRLVHQGIESDLNGLRQAAKSAGFDFAIASAHRDFHRQKAIWNAKYSGLKPILDHDSQVIETAGLCDKAIVEAIMLYSALPGASRHHFGTDLDVYATNCLAAGSSLQLEPWEYEHNGPFHEFSTWLGNAMCEFGFYRPYDQFRGGVACEPWHISHINYAQEMAQRVDVAVICEVISQHDVLGKEVIVSNIEELYQRFIINIADTPLT
ncbi:peptidase M15 [Pseudoalteromonas luteoviolacea]|uniref:Peptidase M15 n=1 Tax=Pseudoalteromonas luteoviolacea TaxID=43657 RepID=A0A1C0TU78_9GAMM|nr:M15 family metallopeptidase [Pseudoalteromonas luteoviolacea]OCQ22873.1 peptidase M15 [Pseudoalteromonas luteoviolacea]